MKIYELYIQKYRVLYELTLPFIQESKKQENTTYKLDLIVGVNGTGKSTLLRLLAELFQRLSSSYYLLPFQFRIRYQLHKDPEQPIMVTVSNRDEDKQKLLKSNQNIVSSDDLYVRVENIYGEIEEEGLRLSLERRYLPDRVVAFTSGSEVDWELQDDPFNGNTPEDLSLLSWQHPDLEQRLALWYAREEEAVPGEEGTNQDSRSVEGNFLFIKNRQLPLVILCGLLVDMDDTAYEHTMPGRRLLDALKEVKIKKLAAFSLKFRLQQGKIALDDQTDIQQLEALASHRIQVHEDLLLVFDLHSSVAAEQQDSTIIQPDIGLIHNLLTVRGNGLQFFRWLAELAEAENGSGPILQEVNLFLERDYTQKRAGTSNQTREQDEQDEQPHLHLLEWLSDGEISFLGRLCLLTLLSEGEALVLLDEPEVHFNDYWKRQLVHMLDQSLKGQYSHVLMTTHSSITLSDVYNTDIWVLRRKGNVTSYAAPPNLRTLGADPSDIIVHVFGAESASGARSVAYLQSEIERILTSDAMDETKKNELKELLSQVGPSPWRYLIRREILALGDNQRTPPRQ